MKIENAFDVPLPAAETWRVLLDIERVAPCFPGAELLERIDERSFKGKVAVKLGPVAVSFVGTAKFEEIDEASRKVTARASGTEQKGRGGAQATVAFTLAETAPRQTHVSIVTDLSLNGQVAQYGRGAAMIQDMAQQMIGRFAENLRAQVHSNASEAPAAAMVEPAKPVSGFSLFFGALWRALRRLFGAQQSPAG
jgi:uncharacterized protein